jgi:hypothetical protein
MRTKRHGNLVTVVINYKVNDKLMGWKWPACDLILKAEKNFKSRWRITPTNTFQAIPCNRIIHQMMDAKQKYRGFSIKAPIRQHQDEQGGFSV